MKKVFNKCFFVVVVVVIVNLLSATVEPIVTNNLAMIQMGTSFDSSMWLQFYLGIKSYRWLLWAIFLYLLFKREIRQMLLKIKEMIKNEENE